MKKKEEEEEEERERGREITFLCEKNMHIMGESDKFIVKR